MRLDVTHRPGQVIVALTPGEGEPRSGRGALARREATFELDVPPGSVHPDLLVLAAVLCARPWIRPQTDITCSIPASPALAASLRSGPKLRLARVDHDLAPRRRPEQGTGTPGLCFSGGTDSVAALAVMPEQTRSYHLLRRTPTDERRATLFDTSAAEQSCSAVRRTGRDVVLVPTDVEYLRNPVGFPHDFTTAVPLLLHADLDRLDAVAWGAPLEATYRLQRGIFREFNDSPFLREWGAVFDAVGLPVCVPIAGVSEVVTSTIVARHDLGAAAQSCVRGRGLGHPCGRCAKCARKSLLAGAVTGSWPSARVIERQWRRLEPTQHLLADPIKVEPVIAYCVHRYLADGGQSELLRRVAAKTGPDPLAWLAGSYEPALRHVPVAYRDEIEARVHRYAAPMTVAQEQSVRGYSVPDAADPGRAAAQAELQRWLAAHPPRDHLARSVGRLRRSLRARARRWRG